MKDEDIDNYQNKQENTPYTSNGNLKADVTFSDSSMGNVANVLKNCNITFSAKTDRVNNYNYQNFDINYSDTESLKLEYIHNQDIFGIKIDNVVNKFIGIENNNLKEFARKLGADEEQIQEIPDKINFNITNFSDLFTPEELTQEKNKYLAIILENLTDEMFSKSENTENDIYTLTLTQQQIEKIKIDILKVLKDDELLIDKAKKFIIENFELKEEKIDEYIDKLKENIQETIDEQDETSESEENTYVFNVYVQNKKLVKTEMVVQTQNSSNESSSERRSLTKTDNGIRLEYIENEDEEPKILSIQKIKSTDEIKYDLTVAEGDTQLLGLAINFTGINTLQQVKEEFEFSYEYSDNSSGILNSNNSGYSSALTDSKTKILYNYTNTKIFESNISKDDVSDGEIMLINTAPSMESIENLFNQIGTRFEEVNKEQMTNLGLEEKENPMIMYSSALNVIQQY